MAKKNKPKDDNDRMRDGTLGDDPFADAEPFDAPPGNGAGSAHQFKIGDWCRTADRGNYGKITELSGEYAKVLFLNQDTKVSAEKWLPLIALVPAYGAEAAQKPEEEDFDLDRDAQGAFELFDDAYRVMLDRLEGRTKPIPVPIPGLADALRGGIWPGLHLLVGNTGSGKSQLALQLAVHAARAKVPTVYVALELGREDTIARLMALLESEHAGRKGPQWADLCYGFGLPTEDRRQQAAAAQLREVAKRSAGALSEMPIRLSFAPPHGWPYTRLHKMVAQLTERTPGHPPLIVLDFLQLVSGSERETRERIGRAAYAGRAVARDFGAAVLVVSSVSREYYATLNGEVEKVKGKPKTEPLGSGNPSRLVGMGKESGELEFSADSVIVLGREKWPGEKPPKGGTVVWAGIAKNRTGSPCWIRLRFNGTWLWEEKEHLPGDEIPPDFVPDTDDPAMEC